MNDLTNIPGTARQTMSSREIAELCGKRHDHVLRDIRNMLVQLYGEDEVDEGLPDRDKAEAFFNKMGWGIASPKLGNERIQGVKVTRDDRGFLSEISLDYNHTMTLIAGYKVKLRKAIIDKWQQLEDQARQAFDPRKALSDPASLRTLLLQNVEKVIELEAKVQADAPKVAAMDLLEASEGSVQVRIAAKLLGMPERKFTRWLQANGWAFRQNGVGPLQGYVDKRNRGYLDHRPNTFFDAKLGEDRTTAQLMVTPKGLARLAKLLAPAAPVKPGAEGHSDDRLL